MLSLTFYLFTPEARKGALCMCPSSSKPVACQRSPFLLQNSDIPLVLGGKVSEYSITTVSLHWYMLSSIQVQCCRPLWQLRGNRVCRVTKITLAESNPDLGILAQLTFCFGLHVLARVNKMPLMAMSIRPLVESRSKPVVCVRRLWLCTHSSPAFCLVLLLPVDATCCGFQFSPRLRYTNVLCLQFQSYSMSF